MKIRATMRAALEDPNIFGMILAGSSWDVWRVILIAAMGEPLINDAERNNAIAASLVVPDPPEWEMSEQTGLE